MQPIEPAEQTLRTCLLFWFDLVWFGFHSGQRVPVGGYLFIYLFPLM